MGVEFDLTGTVDYEVIGFEIVDLRVEPVNVLDKVF